MSDDSFVHLVEASLINVSNQALALGTALQNAAPGDKKMEPNKSIQYLLETAEELAVKAEKCKDF